MEQADKAIAPIPVWAEVQGGCLRIRLGQDQIYEYEIRQDGWQFELVARDDRANQALLELLNTPDMPSMMQLIKVV